MQIEYLSLEELTPYENNPRINDGAVDAVAASIKEFGFNQPIVIDRNGVIVAGHTRYKASMKLGLAEVPCVRADQLTDEQVKAYRLADNKTAELALWDFGKLEQELSEISLDMGDFGFDELDSLPSDPYGYDEGFKEYQEPLGHDALKEYAENADELLIKRRVIITFLPEQEDAVKDMLGVTDETLKVVYDITELHPEYDV